MYPDL